MAFAQVIFGNICYFFALPDNPLRICFPSAGEGEYCMANFTKKAIRDSFLKLLNLLPAFSIVYNIALFSTKRNEDHPIIFYSV